ncbi:hypothetical protein EVAR_51731_1 [Eumeta japonica]|uniref:Uncharacterized protein n=1 Tax=Eumeta variegata TaxID=151549 RepID=A0A4C1XKH3_EUMVA|nr:hypothetical protein EVAR_51731_1 [Eumeta japonica]
MYIEGRNLSKGESERVPGRDASDTRVRDAESPNYRRVFRELQRVLKDPGEASPTCRLRRDAFPTVEAAVRTMFQLRIGPVPTRCRGSSGRAVVAVYRSTSTQQNWKEYSDTVMPLGHRSQMRAAGDGTLAARPRSTVIRRACPAMSLRPHCGPVVFHASPSQQE